MSGATTVYKGVVHGKTIELDQEPGLPEGQSVTVTVEPDGALPNLPSGEGLRRSAGAWAEDATALDAYLEWNRHHRKQGRQELDP